MWCCGNRAGSWRPDSVPFGGTGEFLPVLTKGLFFYSLIPLVVGIVSNPGLAQIAGLQVVAR